MGQQGQVAGSGPGRPCSPVTHVARGMCAIILCSRPQVQRDGQDGEDDHPRFVRRGGPLVESVCGEIRQLHDPAQGELRAWGQQHGIVAHCLASCACARARAHCYRHDPRRAVLPAPARRFAEGHARRALCCPGPCAACLHRVFFRDGHVWRLAHAGYVARPCTHAARVRSQSCGHAANVRPTRPTC